MEIVQLISYFLSVDRTLMCLCILAIQPIIIPFNYTVGQPVSFLFFKSTMSTLIRSGKLANNILMAWEKYAPTQQFIIEADT